MAHVVKTFGRPARARSLAVVARPSWLAPYMDGQIWRLSLRELNSSIAGFRATASNAARAQGMRCRTQHNHGDDFVLVQFTPSA